MRQADYLLPINATRLEKNLVELGVGITRSGENLGITGVKLDNPPDDWLPWIIYEYGLAPLKPWITDSRRLIREGIAFNRIKGTPKALQVALSWVNLQADVIDSPPSVEYRAELEAAGQNPWAHFAEYDLQPPEIPTPSEIAAMAQLAVIAQPLRSRLWRIVHGYDRAVLRLSDNHLDDAYLTDDSGWYPGEPHKMTSSHFVGTPPRSLLPTLPADIAVPKLSFGQGLTQIIDADNAHEMRLYHAVPAQFIAIRIYSWQAHMPVLDDFPEPFEVLASITTNTALRPPAPYYGQTWADSAWQNGDTWQSTNIMIASKEA